MTNSPEELRPVREGQAEEAFALGDLRTRLRRMGPQRTLLALDTLALALVVATYLQLGPPELLFHGVFVVLTVDAFFYGRRVTLIRIVAASIALLGYVALPSLEAGVEPIDLTEWPLMFTIAILVAWMADRERTAVRRYARLYRNARDRLVDAQEEERRRLSRDLHDGIGQTLTALAMALDASAMADSTARERHLAHARRLATGALDETRTIAERVRPPRLEARGLASALHEMAVGCGIPVDLAIDPSASSGLSPAHVVEVYRIAQEAVNNAVHHSGAGEITMRMESVRGGARLVISDDGVGFDDSAVDGRGLGLTGMRERALLMDGRLRVSTRPGVGTRITLVVPIPAGDDAVAAARAMAADRIASHHGS